MVQERIEDLLSIKKGYLVILFLIAIDLVSKFVAEENLVFEEAIPLIPILDLLLVFNSGIAFSIFDFNDYVFSEQLGDMNMLHIIPLHPVAKEQVHAKSIYQVQENYLAQ